MAAIKIRTRKLYQVRVHPAGRVFGQHVGHKGRLLPRAPAARVARRLRQSGLTVTIDPMIVKVTPQQVANLAARYPHSI